MVEQLRGIDAAFLEIETRTAHSQGVGVVRLSPGPRLELHELMALVRQRLPHLDVLHRRLVTVPGGLDRPYWVNTVPDLFAHIHAHHLPPPADPADFERFCAELASTKLDRSRPMWEFWLVDGLPDDRQALVIKIHHSLSDGVGSLALIAQLFDQDPTTPFDEEAVVEPGEDERPPPAPWLLARAALHGLRRPIDAITTSAALVGSVRRLQQVIGESERADLAAPLVTPTLPFAGSITADRSVAFRDLPLDRVKEIAHASGAHVNDVVLAILAGTLRRWLVKHDELPDQPLVAAVPVSTRSLDQLFEPGNYVSACFVHLPIQIEDPRTRLEVAAAVADSGKAAHAAVGGDTLERLMSLFFPFVLTFPADLYQRSGAASAHPAPVNLVVSDVAGPPFELFLAGRPADRFYALGPILDGVALNVTAISYHGVLGIGYVTCPDRLPDLDELADGQDEAFEELAAAFGV